MRKRIILIFLLTLNIKLLAAQEPNIYNFITTPNIALKNNLLYDATTTINLGVEVKISPKWTLDLSGGYNPFTYFDNKKFKHILVQPEFRYWICEPFNGHFLGITTHYSYYNVGNLKLPLNLIPSLEENRFQGWLAGAGLSYGYQWQLSSHWSMEATIGVGYAYLDYEQCDGKKCGELIANNTKHYFGITKLGLSIIYIIR